MANSGTGLLKSRGFCRRIIGFLISIVLLASILPSPRSRAQQSPPSSKLSSALLQAVNGNDLLVWSDSSRQTVRVLIQTTGPISTALTAAVALSGGSIVRTFTSINGVLAELPKSAVLTIAARADVERMTADHLAQQSASHLEAATGSDKVRQLNLLGAGFTGLDGTGIGIAVLDSGIMSSHSDFSNWLGLSRVTASTDIVSSNSNLAQFEIKLGLLSLGLNLNLLGSSNADA